MKGLNKNQLDSAFNESLLALCDHFHVPAGLMTVHVLFNGLAGFDLIVCKNATCLSKLRLQEFVNPKMIGLRFGLTTICMLLNTVHNAFMMELKIEKRERISLVLYLSQKAHCPCIGVMKDQKTYKVMKLADIIEAIELQSEQLN